MPGPEFYETGIGRAFYERTMPKIARALDALVDALVAAAKPGLTPSDIAKQSLEWDPPVAKVANVPEAAPSPRFVGATVNTAGDIVAWDSEGKLWWTYELGGALEHRDSSGWAPWVALPPHPGLTGSDPGGTTP